MKISIDKSILVSALDIVSKAAPTGKVILTILEGILLEAQNGQLHFTRNNLDVAIKYTVNCEVFEPGQVVVNARLFTDLIKRMPDEEIDIKTSDRKMEIEAKQTRMEIGIIPPDGFPGMPDVKAKASFEIEQQSLKEMVSKVAFATATDELHGASLTGICINIKDGALDVVAIDGYMMAWRKMKTDLVDLRILPKGVDLENICKLLDNGNVKVSVSENHTELIAENMRVTLRAINGDFLNYKAILPEKFGTTARIKTKEFQQALERSLIFREASEGKLNSYMTINVTQKGFKLTLAGSSGTFDEDFPIDVDGEDLKIGFDSLKIYNCLKHIDDKEVVIKFSSNLGPCVIVPTESDSYAYMVLPVRV